LRSSVLNEEGIEFETSRFKLSLKGRSLRFGLKKITSSDMTRILKKVYKLKMSLYKFKDVKKFFNNINA